MTANAPFEATKILDLARTDCLGNPLDPRRQRGPEVHPDRKRLTRLIDFPGYTHYNGAVEHDGRLWVACGRCDSAWETWLLNAPVPAPERAWPKGHAS